MEDQAATVAEVSPARNVSRGARWPYFLGVAGLGLLLAGVVVWATSSRYGEEFSPHTFARRTYEYRELPLLGVQFWPITRQDETNDLEFHLRKKKLLGAAAGATSRWDLVTAQPSPGNMNLLDARILCAYLDAVDEKGDQIWLTWTKDHPKLAAVLWPLVAELARENLYVLTPELFRMARMARDVDQFKRELDGHLSQQCATLGAAQHAEGKHREAVKFYTLAVAYDTANQAAYRGRAAAHKALGDDDAAANDLTSADSQ